MNELLPDRFFSVSRRLQSKEAIVYGPGRISYADLKGEALRVGGALAARISRGARVGLVMENSPEWVAAVYGVWAAGGAVVALNPALRGGELKRLLEHSGIECLLLDAEHPESGFLGEKMGERTHVMTIPRVGGVSGEPLSEDSISLDPESLAAIVYTSGTTGHPKGVMLTHRNLAVNTESILGSLPVRQEDRTISILPFQYSYGASVLHTHLAAGATLILERSFMYPHSVLERMVGERVTSLAGVPSTFRLFMRRTELPAHDLSSLRYVTVAGGPLSPREIHEFREQVPHVEFFVMYGQTEASPRLASYGLAESDPKSGCAGRAIAGIELRIRDEDGRDLPPDQVGEVCARGENVMAGYWADEEETDQVLKGGWLHTGDLGYLDPDGFLFLKGRIREMMKSGAHRIAPSEIEEVIREVPGVTDVVVIGDADDLLGQVPKAWVIPFEGSLGHDALPTLRKTILHECQRRLARFKVPKDVEFIGEFPRTASGKVQRHLLFSANQISDG